MAMQRSLFGSKYKPRESEVMGEVTKHLDRRGIYWWRNQRGTYKQGERWIKYGGKAGSGDLFALWPKTGTFWSLELKRPGGILEMDQVKWLLDVRKNGGIASVIECVEDVEMVLKDPLYLPERYKNACYPQG